MHPWPPPHALTWGHPPAPRHARLCLWVCMCGDVGTCGTVRADADMPAGLSGSDMCWTSRNFLSSDQDGPEPALLGVTVQCGGGRLIGTRHRYTWPLDSTGLDCGGPLICPFLFGKHSMVL